MKTDYIIQKFKTHGYTVTRDVTTGNIVIKPKYGFGKSFKSYNAAHKYYFG